MEELNLYFNSTDIWKALMAIAAGIILGYERELKDKSAGLKTITIITLGAALFTMLSQNFSGEGDNFAIAAGIISGIGFLGAGVIFKEGFSIYGLTTAGVIWVAAAIGMAIGFGEFYVAILFLVSTLLVIYGIQYWGKHFAPKNSSLNLQLEIPAAAAEEWEGILSEIATFTKFQTIMKIEKKSDGNLCFLLDIYLHQSQKKDLHQFLLEHNKLVSFSI